jgi:hypothetical protein
MSKFRKGTLISADWKRKYLRECAEIEQKEKINEEIYWIGQTTEMLNIADETTGKKVKKLAYISNVILGRKKKLNNNNNIKKKKETPNAFKTLYITESIRKSHFNLENKVYNKYCIGSKSDK